MPNYPTYGAVMTTTDETCSCYNGLRGKTAFVPREPHVFVANDQRLSTPVTMAVVEQGITLPDSPISKNRFRGFVEFI